MNLSESLELVSKYGIRTSGKVVSLDQALEIKRPIVLKADTSEHKLDKGLVFVGLKTDAEIKHAYEKIKNAGVTGRKYQVFAQPMIKGFEFMAGAIVDDVFGEVLMVGFGGSFSELFRDTSFRAVPITKEDAHEMIDELISSKVFSGFRGKTYSKNALVDVLLGLSKMTQKLQFKEIDLNPIMVDASKAIAVDARVIK
ncbi:MAG: hypothetical protein GOU98_02750 [Candidatus Altiarchaeota archaeon]|nr:hypothetical protein [Candidatus Altiarchaeota archaeon]